MFHPWEKRTVSTLQQLGQTAFDVLAYIFQWKNSQIGANICCGKSSVLNNVKIVPSEVSQKHAT